MPALLLATGCAPDDGGVDPPVARAFGNTLHWSDLRQVVPVEATPEDSAVMARSYVDNWLREQVLLANAERNLPDVRMDVESRIDDYRNSLIIYAYEQALVEQKLDTAVSHAQLEAYFQQNRKEFALRDDILRARWFTVRAQDARQMRLVERWFTNAAPADLHELELWLARNGVAINDPGDTWMNITQLASQVPVRTPEARDQLSRKGRVVLPDSAGTCFVEVLELRPTGEEPPLQLVQNDIRTILLNQRKVKLLADMRDDLYRQALANGEVEIHGD